jgi:putative transposase
MKDWMASDLSGLDLLVIQMDDILMDEDLILVGWRMAAVGVDAKGDKHSLGLIASSRAMENAATLQALIESRRARARPGGTAAAHHRRCQSPVQGNRPNLCPHCGDPASLNP